MTVSVSELCRHGHKPIVYNRDCGRGKYTITNDNNKTLKIKGQRWRESEGAQHRGELPDLRPSAPSSPIQAVSPSGDINNGEENEEEGRGKPRWMHKDDFFTSVDFTKLVGIRGDSELW